MDIEKHSSTTNVKGHTFSYKWVINNFHLCDQEVGEFISSPSFSASNYPNFKWNLKLYPRGDDADKSKEHVSLYLLMQSNNSSKAKAVFNICIIDQQMVHRNELDAAHTFKGHGDGFGWPEFISRTLLFSSLQKLLIDNQLTILCTITVGVKIENLPTESLDLFSENKDEFLLPNEIQSLLKNKQLTDVTLVAGRKSLPAHKAVLAARSPVFLAMLQSNMKEKDAARIEFTDISFDVLTEILEYMYTDEIKNIKQYFRDFMRFADKYDIKGLKLICEKYIYNELSINNAVETLILAETYNCVTLKSHVLKFVLKNAKYIVETSQFKSMKKDIPSLVADMIVAQTHL